MLSHSAYAKVQNNRFITKYWNGATVFYKSSTRDQMVVSICFTQNCCIHAVTSKWQLKAVEIKQMQKMQPSDSLSLIAKE